MAKGKQVGSSLLSLGSFSRSASSSSSSFLVTRCPSGTIAQLSLEGVCHCASLGHGGSPCEGDEPRDRTAICVEDLRHKGKRWATCGLEFQAQFEPEECPVGYVRIGKPEPPKKGKGKKKKGKLAEEGQFICQDALSPYSCGTEQVDCSASPGVLTSLCVDSVCEILMCAEGWTFKVQADGSAACVPLQPTFWSADD